MRKGQEGHCCASGSKEKEYGKSQERFVRGAEKDGYS